MSKHDLPVVRLDGQRVFQIFRDAAPDNMLVFHGFARARALVDAAREIAKGAKLDEADVSVLLLAAWFHDAGYATGRTGNRKQSVELARAFLAEREQPKEIADA